MPPTRAILTTLIAALLPIATAFAAPTIPTLQVSATSYPVAYFAERIGGPQVAVKFPIPPDVDPPFWEPTPAEIRSIQKADLILLNGADLEKWRERSSLPQSKLVDTSAGLRDRFIIIENAVTHSHGSGGEHSHSGTAYTTWLDLEFAAAQAEAAARGMTKKRPQLASIFNANLGRLKAELAALDKDLTGISTSKPGLPILGSHPVYQYLARRYRLNLRSVHWEPNEMPPESEWEALRQALSHHAARTMIWESEPSPAISARLAKLGVQSRIFAPCGNRPQTGDFIKVMQSNADHLRQAFR